jgi:hypothetical protein
MEAHGRCNFQKDDAFLIRGYFSFNGVQLHPIFFEFIGLSGLSGLNRCQCPVNTTKLFFCQNIIGLSGLSSLKSIKPMKNLIKSTLCLNLD